VAHGTSQWYLIALDGDVVLRMRPGMLLGETAGGELSFDPSRAQIQLDVGEDGGLMLSAVDSHELEFGGGACGRSKHLARDRRPEIRLPHNVLRLVTDFVDPAPANETVAIRPLRASAVAAAPQVRATEVTAEPQIHPLPETPLPERPSPERPSIEGPLAEVALSEGPLAETSLQRAPPERPSPAEPLQRPPANAAVAAPPSRFAARFTRRVTAWSAEAQSLDHRRWLRVPGLLRVGVATLRGRWTDGLSGVRTAWAGARFWPIRGTASMVALSVGGLALVLLAGYAAFRDGGPAPATARIDRATPQTASTRAPSSAVEPATDVAGSVVTVLPDESALPVVDARSPTEPEIEGTPVQRPAEPLPPPPPAVALVSRSVPELQPSVVETREEASVADVEESAVAEAPRVAQAIPSPPDATVQPEVEVEAPSAPAPTPTVDLARVLFSADQALEQGRLIAPAEANAYTLYSRVLELNPESAEGRKGLQSVRQGLINRAMAQLASGALEDARASLQSAVEAGADPMLVGNLRDEVDYRQQRIDAQASRDE
jgi:hypothetical protein